MVVVVSSGAAKDDVVVCQGVLRVELIRRRHDLVLQVLLYQNANKSVAWLP